jgi:hypothetical protein
MNYYEFILYFVTFYKLFIIEFCKILFQLVMKANLLLPTKIMYFEIIEIIDVYFNDKYTNSSDK